MKSFMQFDFLVDKEKNTITIKREFAANRQLVWDCYTKSDLLDQWFAPKPFTTKAKSMDFSEGGHWHYAMIDPDGTEYWGWTDYTKIDPIDYYETLDAFSDSEGNQRTDLPKQSGKSISLTKKKIPWWKLLSLMTPLLIWKQLLTWE
ncbi:MAG: hypothetical protein DHS20C17_10670 [Cyclobacteriaceae bacterium]|nr:MAG: hypothetical protein DHS20C17_10670 [Cyclobacteriaceae bacterium]